MLEKIKGIMAVSGEVAAINAKLEETKKAIEALNSSVYGVKEELNSFKEAQNKLKVTFLADSVSIGTCREELMEQISDFKLMKSRMEKKMLESFESAVMAWLSREFERLGKCVKDFEILSSGADEFLKEVSAVRQEIAKLVSLSEKIKEKDFELTKYASRIDSADKEKLELMRRIDTLEKLVSKLRRG